MNVGLATKPHETDARYEQIDHYHTAASYALDEQPGVLAASSDAPYEGDCKYTLIFRVDHGRNERETKLNLARRLEEMAAGLRENIS